MSEPEVTCKNETKIRASGDVFLQSKYESSKILGFYKKIDAWTCVLSTDLSTVCAARGLSSSDGFFNPGLVFTYTQR